MGGAGAGSAAVALALAAINIATISMATACATPTNPTQTTPPAPSPPPAPSSAPALWFGGDVHLGVSARSDLSSITAMMRGAAGVVNLEGPIALGPGGSRNPRKGPIWLANPTGTADFLRAQRILAASIANNHAGDLGMDGEARTVASLRAAAVTPFGRAAGAATLLVDGVDVRLFSHEVEDPGLPATLTSQLGISNLFSVVALHVTGPPSYLPSPALTAAVDAATDAGADVVVVHGSHLVGPVVRRGSAVVAFGLGNLLFDCPCTDQTDAIVLRVPVNGSGRAEIFPIRAGLNGADASPAPDADGILDLLAGLDSTPFTRIGGRGLLQD